MQAGNISECNSSVPSKASPLGGTLTVQKKEGFHAVCLSQNQFFLGRHSKGRNFLRVLQ